MTTKKIIFTTTLLVVLAAGVVMGVAGYWGRGNGSNRDRPEIQNKWPFTAPIDPEQLVSDPRGGVYPVNRVLVTLVNDATRSDAEELATLVDGTIVGFYPSANIYQLEVPATTIDELDAVIVRLESDLRVERASQNATVEFPE